MSIAARSSFVGRRRTPLDHFNAWFNPKFEGFLNLYDRVISGTVTDFLELYVGSFRWPAFNVADSAISIGAGLVLLDLAMAKRKA